MNWGREDLGLYQVPVVMVSVSYPGGGGRRHHRGGVEGGRVTQIFFSLK